MIANLKALAEQTRKERRELPHYWTAPIKVMPRWLAPFRRLAQRFRIRFMMKRTVKVWKKRWVADRDGRRARYVAHWHCPGCGRTNLRAFDSCPQCDGPQTPGLAVL